MNEEAPAAEVPEEAAEAAGGLEGWVPHGAAVLALVLGLVFALGSEGFSLDDAWIHLAYAKSLGAGEGLSYNPGDWETGASSPLWVLALWLWPTGSDPVLPTKFLGAVFHGATAFTGTALTLHLARERATVAQPVPLMSLAALSGVLLAAHPVLLHGVASGMEVPLAAALITGTCFALSRERLVAATLLAFLAVFARPEALAFVGVVGLGLAIARKNARWLAPALGAAAALGAWCVYCLAVSGHLFPNTQYVKASGLHLESLDYLVAEIFPTRPWLAGLGGVVLLGLLAHAELKAEPKRHFCLVLLGAWLAALLATALTRPLHPGVLFFESRYFAPFAAVPVALVALALAHTKRGIALACVLPVALLTSFQLWTTYELQREMGRGVEALHAEPARWMAQELPNDAVVAVEGAGATRYFLPRSVIVVDMLGLNDRALAHVESDNARACEVIARRPTHLFAPEQVAAPLGKVFQMEVLATFEDPAYAQVDPPHPQRSYVLAVRGVQPGWLRRCNATPP